FVHRLTTKPSSGGDMKPIRVFSLILIVNLVLTGALVSISARQESKPQMTKAEVDRMMTELSNWGRWGKDDQLGAVNLINAAKRKQAVGLVREGFSVSLAHDTETERAEDKTSPYEHTMTLSGVNNRGQFSLDG